MYGQDLRTRRAFIQWAGFTFGRDVVGLNDDRLGNYHNVPNMSGTGENGNNVGTGQRRDVSRGSGRAARETNNEPIDGRLECQYQSGELHPWPAISQSLRGLQSQPSVGTVGRLAYGQSSPLNLLHRYARVAGLYTFGGVHLATWHDLV